MKRNDWILIAVVLIIAVLFLMIHLRVNERGDGVIEIQVDGEVYGRYSLADDQIVNIGETNRLEIREHEAVMVWADCPDQVCVHSKAVSRNGESVICLPNQVVASVVSDDSSELDAVAD